MLRIHRSQRADALVAALGEVLAEPPADPLAADLVAVPSKGVERWLAQRLSHTLGALDGDGVCANVLFPSSSRLLDDAVAAADPDYAASVEAWSPQRAVWPLLNVIDRCAPTEQWCRTLAAHLGLDASDDAYDKGRRLAVADKLARFFATYGRSRPSMIKAWLAGRDEQGDGAALPDDLVWQCELWRRLREDIALPTPAELLDDACARLAERGAADLPQRLSIFGPTRLSPSRVRVLAALAQQHAVHLWLHHPSPALWEAVRAAHQPPGRRTGAATFAHHPLLASMARDVGELQQLLEHEAPNTQDQLHPVEQRPATLLGRLQQQLADDAVAAQRFELACDDHSVTVHACHGEARQVEVVREAVLGLLQADPTLEPRDVLIMCPNIEDFAPLVAASFGMADDGDGHPAARLRVQLADRSLRQTNPLLNLLSLLLELAANRVTSTQILDLAGAAAVRRKFGFDDDDIERLGEWTVAAGARWGLDAEHRGAYRLQDVTQGTWQAATDRLLLGVAMEEGVDPVGATLPLDDVDSSDIELAGRFAELLDRVDDAVRYCEQRHRVGDWMQALERTVLGLGEPLDAWQAIQLRRELGEIAEDAEDNDAPLGLADISGLLRSKLAGRPSRASFRTGTLTVCTLVPMRSVPHRVVCLVGMDERRFPRHSITDGDDVLARDPRTGERDPRSEDRQLFLDAICAAKEHLVITYTGADPRNGATVPPCVPLAELLNAIDATATTPGGGPARDAVVIKQPLQPFDQRNFLPDRLGVPRPFSFDPSGLAGARASVRARQPVPPLIPQPLGNPPATDTVDLDDLVKFVQHPVRGFLRQRLEISMSDREEEPDDSLPIELTGLTEWSVGDRLLQRCLAGLPHPTVETLEYLRGELPPGRLGIETIKGIGADVDALLQLCQPQRQHPPVSEDVSVPLPDGRLLVGTVSGIRDRAVLDVKYSKMAPKLRLSAWVRYLALVAQTGDPESRAVLVARNRGRGTGRATRLAYGGVAPTAARDLLTELVQLRDAGLRAPLPLAEKTSAEYAERRERGQSIANALAAVNGHWSDGDFCESREKEHQLAFGTVLSLDELTAAPAPGREQGWFPDEPSRFGVLARRLWAPLLRHESADV